MMQIDSTVVPSGNLANLADLNGEEEVISKLDLESGTVLCNSMLRNNEDAINNDTRIQEYNMIILPTLLDINEFVDIRLLLPTGQDYIVLSKKRVENIDENTVSFNMSEAEILTLNNAIVESYMINGSMLYATKYIEPGMQEKSSSTYTVSREVLGLINKDSNIEQKAREELWDRYNKVTEERNSINSAIEREGDSALSSVQSKVNEQIQT